MRFSVIFVVGIIILDVPFAMANDRTVKIILENKKANGKGWDIIGAGGPDPFIIVDGVSYYGARCQDKKVCVFTIKQIGPVIIEVWDADASSHDFAGKVLCDSGLVCTTDTGEATVIITN